MKLTILCVVNRVYHLSPKESFVENKDHFSKRYQKLVQLNKWFNAEQSHCVLSIWWCSIFVLCFFSLFLDVLNLDFLNIFWDVFCVSFLIFVYKKIVMSINIFMVKCLWMSLSVSEKCIYISVDVWIQETVTQPDVIKGTLCNPSYLKGLPF